MKQKIDNAGMLVCILGLTAIAMVLALRQGRQASPKEHSAREPAGAAIPKTGISSEALNPRIIVPQPVAPGEPPESPLAGVENVDELLITMIEDWARRAPQAAAAWAVELPENANRSEVIASVTAIWAESAPTDSAQFAESLTPGADQIDAVLAVVSVWGRRDPAATARWAEQLPAAELQIKAYERLLSVWAESDPLSGGEWLIARPDSHTRDAAIATYCTMIGQRLPALALTIAQSVVNDELRNQSLEKVIARWLVIDHEAARRALSRAGLPRETIERVLRPMVTRNGE